MLAAILFSTRFATQSSRILRLETGKELLALGTNFSLLFLPIFAYFRKNKRNVTSHFLPELVSSRTVYVHNRFRCLRVRIQFIYLQTVLLKPATANNTDFHFKIPRTDSAWLRYQLKMYKKSLKWEISESATFKLYLIEHCQQDDLLCLTRTCKQFELFIQYFTFSVFENNLVSLRNKVRLLQQLKNVN